MARFVSSNAGYVPNTVVEQNVNTDVLIINDVYRYQLLYGTVIKQMKNFLDLYTAGSFDELKQVFNEQKLRSIMKTNRDINFYNPNVTNLVGFNYDPKMFSNYKRTIYSILTGFSLAVKQTTEFESANTELDKNKELLSSKEKLLDYIQTELSDSMTMNSFNISQTYHVDIALKPWYTKYFELYGPPNDGVFNVEKMATVVELLLETNVITMEEFIANK
jgi:hypothetical protein